MGILPGRSKKEQDDQGDGPGEVEEPEERRLVAYEIAHSPPDSRGWSPVEGYDELSFPMGEEEFRYNEEPLEPGNYKLYGKDQNGRRMKPSDDEDWRMTVTPDDDDGSNGGTTSQTEMPAKVSRELSDIRSTLKGVADQAQQQGEDPEVIQARLKAKAMQMAMANPHFMAAHGDKLALAAFDAFPGGSEQGPGFDEWSDKPMAATFYKLTETVFDEPHKMRDIGENMGRGFGGLLDGMTEGVAQETGSGAETDDTEGDPGADPWAGVEDGPTTLGDLEESADADVAGEVGEEFEDLVVQSETGEGEGEPVPDEDEGQVTLDDSRGMTAGPTAEGMEAVTESEVAASPEVADRATGQDLDPTKCQHVKPDGEQCGNPPQEGSRYCHIDSHGTAEPAQEPARADEAAPGGAEGPETPDEPDAAHDATAADESNGQATADGSGEPDDDEPDPAEVADEL